MSFLALHGCAVEVGGPYSWILGSMMILMVMRTAWEKNTGAVSHDMNCSLDLLEGFLSVLPVGHR